jgi:hypothetical protein
LSKGFTERQLGLQKLKDHKMNVIQNTVMSGQGAKPDTTPNDLYYLEKKAFVKSPEEQAKYQEMTMRGDKPSKEQ